MNIFTTLPEFLQTALKHMLIVEPTPIQARALPLALCGKDVLGTAQTGTGKTLAFLLPLVVRLTANPAENALVLSPTRELAQQILTELEKKGFSFLKVSDLIYKDNYTIDHTGKQIKQ